MHYMLSSGKAVGLVFMELHLCCLRRKCIRSNELQQNKTVKAMEGSNGLKWDWLRPNEGWCI